VLRSSPLKIGERVTAIAMLDDDEAGLAAKHHGALGGRPRKTRAATV